MTLRTAVAALSLVLKGASPVVVTAQSGLAQPEAAAVAQVLRERSFTQVDETRLSQAFMPDLMGANLDLISNPVPSDLPAFLRKDWTEARAACISQSGLPPYNFRTDTRRLFTASDCSKRMAGGLWQRALEHDAATRVLELSRSDKPPHLQLAVYAPEARSKRYLDRDLGARPAEEIAAAVRDALDGKGEGFERPRNPDRTLPTELEGAKSEDQLLGESYKDLGAVVVPAACKPALPRALQVRGSTATAKVIEQRYAKSIAGHATAEDLQCELQDEAVDLTGPAAGMMFPTKANLRCGAEVISANVVSFLASQRVADASACVLEKLLAARCGTAFKPSSARCR